MSAVPLGLCLKQGGGGVSIQFVTLPNQRSHLRLDFIRFDSLPDIRRQRPLLPPRVAGSGRRAPAGERREVRE